MSDLLSVKDLTVQYRHGKTFLTAANNVSFSLQESQTLGLVGESGCGKSTLALAVMGLLPPNESLIPSGSISFQEKNLLTISELEWRRLRGKEMAMIFQDPFAALNPVLRIDYQLQECIILDEGKPNKSRALDLLKKVQLSDPERILNSFPHQLSGGQRQRVMIAMAISRHPKLLIADEPTTALDVTVQDDIVKLLKQLQNEFKMAMIFVTHNIALVKQVSDSLAVMLRGEIVEMGPTETTLRTPKHSYTQELLQNIPRLLPVI
jgi:ABC-type dipeptide/oligopeptide/nickel transport system ATPase component